MKQEHLDTALIVAAMNNDIADNLLEQGANPDIRDRSGLTVAEWVTFIGNV